MKSTILLTGGTGFIGQHLIPKLLDEECSLVLTTRKSSDLTPLKPYLQYINLYRLEDGVENVFKKHTINSIIHLSSMYIKHETTIEEIQEMDEANLDFPSRLLYAAIQNGVKSFINTGTFFEFKPSNKKLTEESERTAFNYYTATKIAFEELLKYYSHKYQLRTTTLRLFSPYGEYEKSKIITLIIKSFLSNSPLSITEGTQELSFTYAGDIANAYIKALNFLQSDKYHTYESFNIGASEAVSIKEVVRKLEKITKKKSAIIFGALPTNNNEIMTSRCNNSKAKRMLEWTPKVSIEEGLEKTYTAMKNNLVY